MGKFSVKTLDQNGLQKAAQDLFTLASKDGTPDIVVGIRTGGYLVAECLKDTLPTGTAFMPITCRRPSTEKKSKSSVIKTTLKKLPYFVTNRLRIAEHIYLTEIKEQKPRTDFIPDEAEISALKEVISAKGENVKILLIDDSIDSGATMQALYNIFKDLAGPSAEIKCAAVTLTTEKPLIQPDYKLHHYVLCRFPWSFDFKG